jgi:hypothetical protein
MSGVMVMQRFILAAFGAGVLFAVTGPAWAAVKISGNSSYAHCQALSGSWVMGSASLDQMTNVLSMTVRLEANSSDAGPKGYVEIELKGVNGAALATAHSPSLAVGGKAPGKPSISSFTSSATIPKSAAAKTTSIAVGAHCQGSSTTTTAKQGFTIDVTPSNP